MSDVQKQEYALRITNANKTGLIVIIYELTLFYLKNAYNTKNILTFRQNIQYTQDCIDELARSLDFDYELAQNLYALYVYVTKALTLAYIRFEVKALEPVIRMFGELIEAYIAVAKLDNSPPVMQNSQKVYAGLTYGKNDIEDINEEAVIASKRGILV